MCLPAVVAEGYGRREGEEEGKIFFFIPTSLQIAIPNYASPSAGDLRELPRVPLRGEGSFGGGGAPRDSAGSGVLIFSAHF